MRKLLKCIDLYVITENKYRLNPCFSQIIAQFAGRKFGILVVFDIITYSTMMFINRYAVHHKP